MQLSSGADTQNICAYLAALSEMTVASQRKYFDLDNPGVRHFLSRKISESVEPKQLWTEISRLAIEVQSAFVEKFFTLENDRNRMSILYFPELAYERFKSKSMRETFVLIMEAIGFSFPLPAVPKVLDRSLKVQAQKVLDFLLFYSERLNSASFKEGWAGYFDWIESLIEHLSELFLSNPLDVTASAERQATLRHSFHRCFIRGFLGLPASERSPQLNQKMEGMIPGLLRTISGQNTPAFQNDLLHILGIILTFPLGKQKEFLETPQAIATFKPFLEGVITGSGYPNAFRVALKNSFKLLDESLRVSVLVRAFGPLSACRYAETGFPSLLPQLLNVPGAETLSNWRAEIQTSPPEVQKIWVEFLIRISQQPQHKNSPVALEFNALLQTSSFGLLFNPNYWTPEDTVWLKEEKVAIFLNMSQLADEAAFRNFGLAECFDAMTVEGQKKFLKKIYLLDNQLSPEYLAVHEQIRLQLLMLPEANQVELFNRFIFSFGPAELLSLSSEDLEKIHSSWREIGLSESNEKALTEVFFKSIRRAVLHPKVRVPEGRRSYLDVFIDCVKPSMVTPSGKNFFVQTQDFWFDHLWRDRSSEERTRVFRQHFLSKSHKNNAWIHKAMSPDQRRLIIEDAVSNHSPDKGLHLFSSKSQNLKSLFELLTPRNGFEAEDLYRPGMNLHFYSCAA